MRHADIRKGAVYTMKVSGRISLVRVTDIRLSASFRGDRDVYHYIGRNLNTGRAVRARSPQRFRREVSPEELRRCLEHKET